MGRPRSASCRINQSSSPAEIRPYERGTSWSVTTRGLAEVLDVAALEGAADRREDKGPARYDELDVEQVEAPGSAVVLERNSARRRAAGLRVLPTGDLAAGE